MHKFQTQLVPEEGAVQRGSADHGAPIHPIVVWLWSTIQDRRLSHTDVAKDANVSSRSLRKWREGTRSPRLAELERVCNSLGYSIRVVCSEGK